MRGKAGGENFFLRGPWTTILSFDMSTYLPVDGRLMSIRPPTAPGRPCVRCSKGLFSGLSASSPPASPPLPGPLHSSSLPSSPPLTPPRRTSSRPPCSFKPFWFVPNSTFNSNHNFSHSRMWQCPPDRGKMKAESPWGRELEHDHHDHSSH